MSRLTQLTTLTAAILLATGAGTASAASGPIKIGVQAPITGEYAAEGQGIQNGVKLLVDEQNKAGGLLGRKIQVTVCDDEGKAAQAAICARKLVNDGVIAVIGTYTSGAALAAAPIYSAANVIQTSDGTSDELTQKGWKTFFRNAPPNSDEAEFTAKYLVNVKQYKRIAILSDHSSYATGLAKATTKSIEALHGNIVANDFINAGTQDYSAVLTKVKSKNPDILYFSGYYTDGGLIRAQMKQLSMNAVFVGGDANQNAAFAKIAGNAAQGAVIINVPAPENLPYPEAKKFLADYTKTFGSAPPSIYTFTNADGLRAVFAAIEATKSAETSKLIPWLHDMKQPFAGVTGPFKWDAKGERIGSPMSAFEVEANGTYKTIYPTN
ncbi:MAG: branched-chain amino acid ABC transporter substrate-binding protein [Castellaniella sp.]|uniref:branched-chain amino acid ABC transporter substrate-binding protein n=1 Tax=Castellaniella sp. TaxID=1955812 RepID=UPI00121F4B3A|nr:branched-chain amino acid ABC transporter substrate-binding protein [Castellaniella sp.]TAN27795.1 MAG: branched-chain amino acid ABC transporter substrate-binding protein [Castellaniella sp.]